MMATQSQIEFATAELTKATDAWKRADKELLTAQTDKASADSRLRGLQPQVAEKLAEVNAKQAVLKTLLNEDPNT